jgi:hypothetical protein
MSHKEAHMTAKILTQYGKHSQDYIGNFLQLMPLLKENPYTPSSLLPKSILRHVPRLDEMLVIQEMLQDCTSSVDANIINGVGTVEPRNCYWRIALA